MSTERQHQGSNPGKNAKDEPVTHLLIPLGSSRPVPVDARVVRHNLSRHPDDKTRPGEEKTIPPDDTGKIN